MSTPGRVRIGELSRRTGVSVDVLRVWERRYSLLSPERSAGGQRLYSTEDEARIRAMLEHQNEGLSAAEAARIVTSKAFFDTTATTAELLAPLTAAIDALDEPGTHAALDRAIARLGIEGALTEVVMPYLRELGDRWARGNITVAEEHFASRLLHARLLGAARGWDAGDGPRALLACPSGEEHDLALISFGIALRRRGWRIVYLGANTPIGAIEEMVTAFHVDAVVLAATTPGRFADVVGDLHRLASRVPVALGGAGAIAKLAEDAAARRLSGDPVAGAAEIAQMISPR